jgi:hypothetical protein
VARKFAGDLSGWETAMWLRAGFAAALWGVSVFFAEAAAGPAIGRASDSLEQRIELRLREPCGPAREETRPAGPDEAVFEPWELVGV